MSILTFIITCVLCISLTLLLFAVAMLINKINSDKEKDYTYKEAICGILISAVVIILGSVSLHYLKLYKENTYIKTNNNILTTYSYSCNMNVLYLNGSGKYSQNTIYLDINKNTVSCEYVEMKYKDYLKLTK